MHAKKNTETWRKKRIQRRLPCAAPRSLTKSLLRYRGCTFSSAPPRNGQATTVPGDLGLHPRAHGQVFHRLRAFREVEFRYGGLALARGEARLEPSAEAGSTRTQSLRYITYDSGTSTASTASAAGESLADELSAWRVAAARPSRRRVPAVHGLFCC